VSRESSKDYSSSSYFLYTKKDKEKFSSGSVTVYAGRIKSLAGHLRSWTEAWIGQAPTEKFLVSR